MVVMYIGTLKKCSICKEHLPHISFYKNRCNADGYEYFCKVCNSLKTKRYQQANRLSVIAIARKWREGNPQLVHRATRGWQERNKKIHLERLRARVMANYHYPLARICSIDDCNEVGERHHPNYSKPKEIEWLCLKHHREFHRQPIVV